MVSTLYPSVAISHTPDAATHCSFASVESHMYPARRDFTPSTELTAQPYVVSLGRLYRLSRAGHLWARFIKVFNKVMYEPPMLGSEI